MERIERFGGHLSAMVILGGPLTGPSAPVPLLARDAVVIGLPSVDQVAAIRFVGEMLAERGHIAEQYVDAMVEREMQVPTFLGNGVAMPHGTFESSGWIKSTGIVVAQYPDGIDWGGNGIVRIVIGLAALGDDHAQALGYITNALRDASGAEELAATTDHQFLYDALTSSGLASTQIGSAGHSIVVRCEGGLHARPAAKIVELAKAFEGDITIRKGGKSAKATSILSVLALGAARSDRVEVVVDAPDQVVRAEVIDEIERVLASDGGF